MKKNIFVTQPKMPPLAEFVSCLETIWENKILTNCGPFHQKLEEELCKYLKVKYLSLFNNATIALVTALKALDVKGEVITTPFSYVATSHSLLWNGLDPVFVDIDPKTLNLDEQQLKSAITERTTAILPVHCYGHPCNTNAIAEIARSNNLRVIYDAAHAFGVEIADRSVLLEGDLSIVSFHATKVFSTIEGGAIISQTQEMKKRIDLLRSFGQHGETTVIETGINGKMSEVHAAFGLLQLNYIEAALKRRGEIDRMYRRILEKKKGITCLPDTGESKKNYAYFPILVESSYPMSRDDLYLHMKNNGINPRKYFYPLITSFPMYSSLPTAQQENVPHAVDAAEKVLCLPIYPDLTDDDVLRVTDLI